MIKDDRYRVGIYTDWHNPESISNYKAKIVNGTTFIMLPQYPSPNHRFIIKDFIEVGNREDIIKENEFWVDYKEGFVYFHPSLQDTWITIKEFYGIGINRIDAKRVVTKLDATGNVVQVLQDIIDAYKEIFEALANAMQLVKDVQHSLEVLESTQNPVFIVAKDQWTQYTEGGITKYKTTINHNLLSKNLHITAIDIATDMNMGSPPFKTIDFDNIEVYSLEAKDIKYIISASYYNGLIDNDRTNEILTELYDARLGEPTLKDKIRDMDSQLTSNVNKINSQLEDITKEYAKKTEVNELASNKAEQTDLEKTNTKVSKNTEEIATQSARIDSFTSLTNGSTTGDAELIDGHIGANGINYTNIGTAIREQILDLKNYLDLLAKSTDVDGIKENVIYNDWTIGALNDLSIGDTLSFNTTLTWYSYAYINVNENDIISFTFRRSNDAQLYAVGVNSSNTVVYIDNSVVTSGNFTDIKIRIPRGVSKLYLCSQTTTEPDSTWFSAKKFTRNSLATKNYISKILSNYSTKVINIGSGITSGVNFSVGHTFNTFFRVVDKNESVVKKYRVKNASGINQECVPNKLYFFNEMYNSDTYQFQFYIDGLVKDDSGNVKGGDITVEYWLDENSLIQGSGIKIGSITKEHLDNEFKNDIESTIDAVKTIVSTIPDYIQENIDTVRNKLDSIQTANTSSIMFMTDIHLLAYSGDTNNTFLPIKRAVDAIKEIDKTNNIDFNVLGGDYLWNNNTGSTRERVVRDYKYLQNIFYPLKDKIFAIKGNHDDNTIAIGTNFGSNVVVLPDEQWRYIGKQYEKSGVVMDATNHNKMYGYYDIPSQKIRCIFINSVDIPYNKISNHNSADGYDYEFHGQSELDISSEQYNFIRNALTFNEKGWGVVMFCHHGVVQNTIIEDSNDILKPLIHAYINKTTYTGTLTDKSGITFDSSCDFTNNKSNELIACICGHNHADKSELIDNEILLISTGSSCSSQPSIINGVKLNPEYESSTETIFDIFTINRETRKIYATRYGLGNDREWNY